jgi:hypothetical protein
VKSSLEIQDREIKIEIEIEKKKRKSQKERKKIVRRETITERKSL